MKVLAIETSCDETAVALLECDGGIANPTFNVFGDTVLSQAMKHAEFGGVYPNLAKREHSKNLVPVLTKTLKEANELHEGSTEVQKEKLETLLEREPELLKQLLIFLSKHSAPEIDAIAVTQGPGLEPALWVGLNFAKALSLVWYKPLVPINHMEGHVMSVLVKTDIPNDKNQISNVTIDFPALALLVSGGHTEIVLAKDWLQYEIIGQTRDDAVGEAFDKVARILDLGYPGGPEISKQAAIAREKKLQSDIAFPRPMKDSGDYDFSFSGLKTAVLYKVKELGNLDEQTKQVIAREFEDAAVDIVVYKTKKALEEHAVKTLIAGGGVIANTTLRNALSELVEGYPDTQLLIPDMSLTGDNAVMIGIAGYFRALKNEYAKSPKNVLAQGNLKLS